MALHGETSGLDGVVCDCGQQLALEVLRSAAGYYLGYSCPDCGPWSRETSHFWYIRRRRCGTCRTRTALATHETMDLEFKMQILTTSDVTSEPEWVTLIQGELGVPVETDTQAALAMADFEKKMVGRYIRFTYEKAR